MVSVTFYWRCGREGSMILRMKWYSRAIQHLSFMTHVALKQAVHLSWIKLRTLCKNVQPPKNLGIICMWFGKWLSGNIKVHLNASCVGTAFQSVMKLDQLQEQSWISLMSVGLVEVCKLLIISWISPFLFEQFLLLSCLQRQICLMPKPWNTWLMLEWMLKMLQLKLQKNQLTGFKKSLVSSFIKKSILPRNMCIFEV